MTIEDLVKKLLAIPIEDSADSINNAIKKWITDCNHESS